MRLLRYFANRYRAQSVLVLFCVLLGGALDGLGISAMLPVVEIAMRESTSELASEPAETSALGAAVDSVLETIGLSPSLRRTRRRCVMPLSGTTPKSSRSLEMLTVGVYLFGFGGPVLTVVCLAIMIARYF